MTTETMTDRSSEMTRFHRWLYSHNACEEGVALVRQHPTPDAWWAASGRGDHMLWLCGRAGVRRQDLVLAACACARLALPHVQPGEDCPLRVIETAERWARGETGVTLADVRAAADAAYDAYVYAAAAAAYAGYAAADADDAAYAATYAYSAAADADARTRILHQCANLVRERFPWSVVAAAMETKP